MQGFKLKLVNYSKQHIGITAISLPTVRRNVWMYSDEWEWDVKGTPQCLLKLLPLVILLEPVRC